MEETMIILNFFHPFTEEQKLQIEELIDQKITEIRQIPVNFDNEKPYELQVEALVKQCGFTLQEWQTERILVIPPSYNFITVTLLAALHGVMGYFPPVIRIRPILNSVPPHFEVAEIINLQEIRERFRKWR